MLSTFGFFTASILALSAAASPLIDSRDIQCFTRGKCPNAQGDCEVNDFVWTKPVFSPGALATTSLGDKLKSCSITPDGLKTLVANLASDAHSKHKCTDPAVGPFAASSGVQFTWNKDVGNIAEYATAIQWLSNTVDVAGSSGQCFGGSVKDVHGAVQSEYNFLHG